MASIGLFEAFLALFCFLIVNYFLNKKPFDFLHIKKTLQSYPWNWPFYGMTPGLLVRIHRINDSVEVLENSNMTFPFKGPWFAGKNVLITVDPANIQHIVSSNFSNYIKGAEFQEIFEVYGDGIINSDAERASKLKKCYQALLHHQGFQKDSMSVTTSKLKDVLLPLFNHFSEAGTVVDLQDVFRRFTFDTTLVTITGSDPRSLSIDMHENEFVKALDDVAEAIVYRHFTLRFMWNLQKWIGFGPEKKMVEADAIIDRVCAKYISAKRDEIQQGTQDGATSWFYFSHEARTGSERDKQFNRLRSKPVPP
ncbi:hypothetical protein YC2023_096146 [Brassica napus]